MRTFNYTITDEVGIHARPAGMLVKEVKKFASNITIVKDGKRADAKKLMLLMSLGVKCGEKITVEIEGTDEEEASVALEAFFNANL